jgi:hypothetical protein
MREVVEFDRRARIRRLPTVRRLQLYSDLGHSISCVENSMNGDGNGNFKFKNGQRSVFDTLMEAKGEETRHIRAFFNLINWW